MLQNIPRISVLIITYRQETMIQRAIESLLCQRDYIYEICISDDCSPDKTWDVLREYSDKYPGLFKLHRNEQNVGIFENIEHTWNMPSGDLIYQLSGDDECGKGWFKAVVNYIRDNKLDYKNELFCVFCDHKCIYPNNDSYVAKNRFAKNCPNQLKYYERGLLFNRGVCYSIGILKKFSKVSCGRSYKVENLQDSLIHLYSKKCYYIQKVGNIYYSAIGVSSNMGQEQLKEHDLTMVYAFEFFYQHGRNIDKYDQNMPIYNIAQKHFRRDRSFINFCKLISAYFKCFDPKIGFKEVDLRKNVFRLIRRMPHSKPIHW